MVTSSDIPHGGRIGRDKNIALCQYVTAAGYVFLWSESQSGGADQISGKQSEGALSVRSLLTGSNMTYQQTSRRWLSFWISIDLHLPWNIWPVLPCHFLIEELV